MKQSELPGDNKMSFEGCSTEALNGPPQDGDVSVDLQDIESIAFVSSLLEIICRTTNMRFSAVARVTEHSWTALAIRDGLAFGLSPGSQLDIHTTLCKEARAALNPIIIEQASTDEVYCGHHTPGMYGFESYVSVPIVLPDGEYFGNLCALDPLPAKLREPHVLEMFQMFADMLGTNLSNIRQRRVAQTAVKDEQETGRLREHFVAVLGHDLRNPLGMISSGLEVLRLAPDNASMVMNMTTRMSKSVNRMKGLVDDLMDYSRGRFGGGVGLNIQNVSDIDEALGDVVEEMRVANSGRNFDTLIEVGRTIRCDRARLQQLLSNLISNALTHGFQDTPILIRAVIPEEADDRLLIMVANEGVPIPAAEQVKLFHAFSYGQRIEDKSSGLGLGLFICAEIVKAHKGTLDVSSESGERTIFRALLPL